MKTVNIKGKEYVMVNERLKQFRENYKGYSLISEIVNLTEDSCVMKAIILDADGKTVATGHAQEDRTSSMINKTSFVENCETSAWGRALANFGIGIDTSVASAEEVDMAIAKQELLGGNYKFSSGKHKDKTIAEVYEQDEEYLRALMESNHVSNIIKNNIKEFLFETKGEN